jgi:hypothetical protein
MSTSTTKCTSKFGPDRCRIHGNKSPLAAMYSSVHAAANLHVSKKQLKDVSDWDTYVEGKALVEHDQLVYDASLAGMKALKTKMNNIPQYVDRERYDELDARYTAAKKYREEQLATDPTVALRNQEFQNKLDSVTKVTYPGLESISVNYKQIDRIPYGTPVAFLLKNGSTFIGRSGDNIINGYESLNRFEKLLPIRGSFLPTFRFGKPNEDDVKNSSFVIKLHPVVSSRISVKDVAELRVLNDDAFEDGVDKYKSSNEISSVEISDITAADNSEYFRAEGSDFIYEGEGLRFGDDAYSWNAMGGQIMRGTSVSFDGANTKMHRIIVPNSEL